MKKSLIKKIPLIVFVLLFCSIIAFALQDGGKLHIYKQGKVTATIADTEFDSAKVENATLNVYKANSVIFSNASAGVDSITLAEPVGAVEIYVENPSFEIGATGTKTYEFNTIPGWNWGNPQYLSNVPSPQQDKHGSYLLNKDQGGWSHFSDPSSIDGNYALMVGHYSRQVWQQLQEKMQSSCRYTITVDAGMNQWVSPWNDRDHFVRIQLGFFNGETGDLNNMTVLKEERIPLASENKGKLTGKILSYESSPESAYAGKNLVITLSGYKKQDPFANYEVIQWENDNSVSQYFFDNVKVTRENIASEVKPPFYRGAQMTFAHFMMEHGGIKYYENGQEKDPYQSLKDHGANMIRLCLNADARPVKNSAITYKIDHWTWEEVQKQLLHCKQIGLDVYLTIQLSSDNGGKIPDNWKAMNLTQVQLADFLYNWIYEKLDWAGQNGCVPAIISIGNETNIDFLWDPMYWDEANALASDPKYVGIDADNVARRAHAAMMLNKGYDAVDAINAKYGLKAKKLLHCHIIGQAYYMVDRWIRMGVTNFDIAGLSWYANEKNGNHMYGWESFAQYAKYHWQRHKKQFLLTEVAHPFTEGNFDNTAQMAPWAQPGYPATPAGQRKYMEDICEDVASGGGLGVIYWGGEWVANDMYVYHDFRGSTWEDKSFWTSERNNPVHELHAGVDWMNRDYNGVFKRRLYTRAEDMMELYDKTVEGSGEGEYPANARATFKAVIDRGIALYENPKASQDRVDELCIIMDEAIPEFEDRMNPFVSKLTGMITEAANLISQTSIGDGDGMIPSQADKDDLAAAAAQAGQFLQSTPIITQQTLTPELDRLRKALCIFKSKIPGLYEVAITNPSFEPQTPNDDRFIMDWNNIPGWNWTEPRYITGFKPSDLTGGTRQANCLLKKGDWQIGNDQNVDGDYVMQLYEYSKPVWQFLEEGVFNGAHYTITANAGMYNWFPQENNFIRIQLILFNGKPGDFNNITVLQSQDFTNISIAALEELRMEYDTPESSEYAGKQMAVTFHGYYKKEISSAGEIDKSGSYDHKYFVDKVKITREKY